MSIGEFIKDKIGILLLNVLLFILLGAIMFAINFSYIIIIFAFCIWFFPLISYMAVEFIRFKKYYNEIINTLDKLDRKYLLPEIIKEADSIQEEKINCILKEISRDMHENIKYYKDMQMDYREYIETWVHEIKTPIASTKLIIENNKSEVTNKIDFQIDKIETFIEQVLYYSRSDNVNKDYIIKEINIDHVVRNVIKRNYRDFIYKKIKLDVRDINQIVYTDEKWIEFIVNQIIGNSIKYLVRKDSLITIDSFKKSNSVILTISDNGKGIVEKDINRVFDKGFTGENGREFGKSTGMGLYLCRKLCLKLGLKISIDSVVNKGTKVTLVFPLSTMMAFTDN